MSGFSFSDLQKVAKDAGFSLVPDGEYEAGIHAAVSKQTSNGKDMLKLTWKIAQGPTKGTVWSNMVISPESGAALSIFFRQMKALGLGDEYFAGNPSLEQVAKALVGRRAKITVATQQWNGQDRNAVTGIAPSTGGSNGAPMVGGNGSAGVPNIPAAPAVSPTPDSASAPTPAPAQVPAPSTQMAQGPSQGLPDDPF